MHRAGQADSLRLDQEPWKTNFQAHLPACCLAIKMSMHPKERIFKVFKYELQTVHKKFYKLVNIWMQPMLGRLLAFEVKNELLSNYQHWSWPLRLMEWELHPELEINPLTAAYVNNSTGASELIVVSIGDPSMIALVLLSLVDPANSESFRLRLSDSKF